MKKQLFGTISVSLESDTSFPMYHHALKLNLSENLSYFYGILGDCSLSQKWFWLDEASKISNKDAI